MELPATPDPGNRRRIICFVVGSLIAVVALTLVVYFKDEPLDDHSDLVPQIERTEAGEAAFKAWIAAAAAVDESTWEAPPVDFTEMVKGALPWDAGAAADMLASQREVLERAFRADALGPFQTPAMKSLDETGIDTGAILRVLRILQLASVERAQAGDFAAAVDTARVGLRFGDHLVEGGNSFLSYLVACVSQQLAFSTIEHIGGMAISDPGLVELMASLGNEPDQNGAFQETVRAEFSMLGNALDHRDEFEEWGTLRPDPPPAVLFHCNRTLNEAADFYRDLIAEVAKQPDQRSLPIPRDPPTGLGRYAVNAYGNYLNASPGIAEMLLSTADQSSAHRRVVRVLLAVLRYELAEGELPAALAELVPRYLDAVPADPFDGKPIRYDAARGILWVIGKDLTDDGGSPEADNGFRQKDADPTLFIHPPEAPSP